MDDELKRLVEQSLKNVAEKKYMLLDQDGWYHYEIYADYRDEFDDKTIAEMLESKVPIEAFYDKLWECYQECEMQIEDEVVSDVVENIQDTAPKDSSYRMGLGYDELCDVRDYVRESLDFNYPAKHYLDQEVYVDIIVDTGDWNYEFVLNNVYPAYGGCDVDKLDDKASLVWLVKQQGYTKEDLQRALTSDKPELESEFLQSVRSEVINEASHINALVILVKMDLEDLLRINTLMKNKSNDGKVVYDADDRNNCGYIVIGNEAMLGLVDPYSGGGSVLEIALDKDIELPIKYISEAIPDNALWRYSIESIYDLWLGCWKDCLKKIVEPENAEVV